MKQFKNMAELAFLAAIFSAGAYLRVDQLAISPEWYSDEGAFIEVAKNMLNGKWQYFALQGSPLLVGRPPLFFYVLSLAFKLFGIQMIVLRGLTVGYGLLSVALLYLIARKIFGLKIALLAAGILAIFPGAVALNRVGFTYNQLTPLFLINFYSNWEFSKEHKPFWGCAACVTAGLSLSSEYVGIAAVILTLAILLLSGWRWWLAGSILIALPIILTLGPVASVDPQGLIQDLDYTFSRVSLPFPVQIVNSLIFFGHLLQREIWILLGLIGIFLLPERRGRLMILFLFALIIFLLVRLSSPPKHHLIPLLPFSCLGIASFIKESHSYVSKNLTNDLVRTVEHITDRLFAKVSTRNFSGLGHFTSRIAILVIFISPFLWMISFDEADIQARGMLFYSQEVLKEGFAPSEDINLVIQELNNRTGSEIITIASPHVGWALAGKVIDIQQATAFSGGESYALPQLARPRFAFDGSVAQATYAIEDDLWRIWGTRMMPGVPPILAEIQKWPVIFTAGEFQIHKNPRH